MQTEIETSEQLPEVVPQNIIRVETALSRYPAHRLSKKGMMDITVTETTNDGEVRVKWVVSHNSRHGQPGPLAYKIDTLIVNRRIEESTRPVPRRIRLGSLSQVCKELGLSDSGKNRNNIRESLRQNAFAGISACIRYRQRNGRERTLEADFTRYSVVFTGESFPDEDRRADAVYIILNDVFMQVINGAMTRPLDYEYLKELSAGPQRFYELLSYQMFAALKNGRPQARLVYSEFCVYAPQTRYFDSNRVHKQMAKVHAPHKESGYIRAIEFQVTTDAQNKPDWVILYTPGPRARAEYRAFTKRGGPTVLEVEQGPPVLDAPQQLSELERELVLRGVTESSARELAAEYSEERVRTQIEHIDFVVETEPKKIANRGAYLAKAIRDNFDAPPDFEPKATREERKRVEQEQRRQKEAQERAVRAEKRREDEMQRKVQEYWDTLNKDEQQELETRALAGAGAEELATYEAAKAKSLRDMARGHIRRSYIRKLIEAQEQNNNPKR